MSVERRRVLMTADTVGGVWTYVLELARALDSHGFEVLLATMGTPLNAAQRAAAESIPNVSLAESSLKLEWMDDPWEDVAQAGSWLLELARRFQPDVVHLNGYAHAALPWPAPVIVAAHSCVLSWWQAVKKQPAPGGWDTYREKVRRGLASADLVIAPSRTMARALREHYPGAASRVRVIPNGRSPRLYRPQAKSSLVLAAGRVWDEGKNIAALARVAPRIPWPVFVAGDAQQAELPNVNWLGRLDEEQLAGWYRKAAIYCLPARYEPFGLSALEAALAGCALVLGDIPSLRENWRESAVFVPPDDDAALERELNSLIANPHRMASLRARASAMACKLTPRRMAARYVSAYESVLAARRERLCA